jgi:DNA-binding PadR family transcriptional regulator
VSTNLNELESCPTRLGHALLTLIHRMGRVTHAYEVVKIVRERGGALGSSESTIYRELKNLARHGYLEAVAGEVKTSKRPVVAYRSTPLGAQALREWLETEVEFPQVDTSELIPRIRAARLVPAQAVLLSLQTLQEDFEGELDRLRWLERQARKSGDWDTVTDLEFQLKRQLVETYSEWTNRVVLVFKTLRDDELHSKDETAVAEMSEFLRRGRSG